MIGTLNLGTSFLFPAGKWFFEMGSVLDSGKSTGRVCSIRGDVSRNRTAQAFQRHSPLVRVGRGTERAGFFQNLLSCGLAFLAIFFLMQLLRVPTATRCSNSACQWLAGFVKELTSFFHHWWPSRRGVLQMAGRKQPSGIPGNSEHKEKEVGLMI
jgi:hypothetical protein